MASIRESILAIVAPKQDVTGSGSYPKAQSLDQIAINDEELSLIRSELITYGKPYTEEFFNVETNQYLVWDYIDQVFRDKLNGDEYFMRVFYDDFSDLVQSAIDWTFVDSATSVNDWEFGTDGIDLGKTNGMYVSNDGGTTNAYSNDTGVAHSTVDVAIPSGSKVKVKVRMKSNGEPGFDDCRLFVYNAPTAPTADVLQPLISQELLVVGDSVFLDFEFELDNTYTGTTCSFSFQWRADGSISGQPPGHISEFEVLYK